MAIRLRNQKEFVVNLTLSGTQTTTTTGPGGRVCSPPMPYAGRIKAIYAVLGTAGTTNTQTTDILKNGTTLAGSGTVLSFATTATAPTYAALTSAAPTVAKGDVLQAVNTAIHTTPAVDCSIAVVIEKLNAGAPVVATQTGTYGSDLDAV